MELIPNQPIIFDENINPCNLGEREIPNLVNQDDQTYYQFKLLPCEGEPQRLANPYFDIVSDWIVIGGGFSYGPTSNGLQYIGPSSGNSIYQDVLVQADMYEIKVKINSVSGGAVNIGTQDPPNTAVFTEQLSITRPGEYTAYVLSQGDRLIISPDANVTEFTMEYCEARKVDYRVWFVLKDDDGNVVDIKKFEDGVKIDTFTFTNPFTGITTTTTLVVYEHPGDAFFLHDNYVTGVAFWDGKTNGVYQMCIADPCQNTGSQQFARNGEFSEELPSTIVWEFVTPSAFMGISGGILSFLGGAPANTASAQQLEAITENVTYDVEINITSIDPGVTLDVIFGNDIDSFTTSGVHNFQMTSTAGQTLAIRGIGDGEWTLDYIRVTAIDADLNPEFCGTKMDLCDNHDCTLVLHMCNDEDAFGMAFNGTPFIPNVRVQARKVNPTYEFIDVIKEDDSVGNRRVVYGERRKRELLKIGAVQKRIHDFLSLSLIVDHFAIGNEVYFVDSEEYEPIYSDRRENIAYVQLEVSERQQDIRNVSCVASLEPCFLPPNSLLLNSGEAITLNDDDAIQIRTP